MRKETITYTDYFGAEQTRDFYFHYSEAELAKMELGTTGGITRFVEKIVQTKDNPKLTELFESFILDAYGEKSEDGQRFIKNDEVREGFKQTPAYSILFMKLMTDDEALAEFITQVIPEDVRTRAAKVEAENEGITTKIFSNAQIEAKQ